MGKTNFTCKGVQSLFPLLQGQWSFKSTALSFMVPRKPCSKIRSMGRPKRCDWYLLPRIILTRMKLLNEFDTEIVVLWSDGLWGVRRMVGCTTLTNCRSTAWHLLWLGFCSTGKMWRVPYPSGAPMPNGIRGPIFGTEHTRAISTPSSWWSANSGRKLGVTCNFTFHIVTHLLEFRASILQVRHWTHQRKRVTDSGWFWAAVVTIPSWSIRSTSGCWERKMQPASSKATEHKSGTPPIINNPWLYHAFKLLRYVRRHLVFKTCQINLITVHNNVIAAGRKKFCLMVSLYVTSHQGFRTGSEAIPSTI